jgi:ligand-binding sensor protein/AraC-like DNA-binding protein
LQNSILQLDYLINVNNFQKIQDAMAEATEMAMLTVDYKGNPITSHSRCSSFCSAIRANPEYSKLCNKCDSRGGLEATRLQQPYIYICHMGILDLAVPIIVDGHYIGAVMAGQVLIDENDMETLETIVSDKHTNEKAKHEFKEQYNCLSRMSLDRVKATANMVFQISNYIVEEALLKINLNDMNQKMLTLTLSKQDMLSDLSEANIYHKTHKYYEIDNSAQSHKNEDNATGDVPSNVLQYGAWGNASTFIKSGALISPGTSNNPSALINLNDTIKPSTVNMLYKDNIILKPALEYIQENFHMAISLDDMAAKCNISTSYFSKLFKKAKGDNFANYINKIRIEKAKEYLETTDMPILNIGFELGFEDCGYFIKVFKKFEGMTPSVYRNEYQQR